MPDAPLHTVILDYGQVLTRAQRPDALARMARVLGAPEDATARAYWARRLEYDLGTPVEEYWQTVARELGADEPGADAIRSLIELDVWSWTDYREPVWELAESFRSQGGRTAILSNGVPEIMARVHVERALDERFDAVIVSCEVGCSKPDPAIYALTLSRLGAEPAGTLFVDDREENVSAARALGMQALLFAGAEAEAALRSALIPAPGA